MSRIGKLPVNLPAGVTVTVSPDNVVSVKGPLGTLSQKVDSDITVTVEGNEVHVTRPTDQPRHRSMHGLYRSLIHNMVVGVSEGYQIQQELVGVGYKAEMQGSVLQMSLGYSHDIYFEMPNEITATAVTEKKSNPIVTLKRASTSSSSDRWLPRSARCASRNPTRARVSSSWANSSAARPVNLLMPNSKIV